MDYTMQQMAFVIQAVVSHRPWCNMGDVAVALPLAPIRDLRAAVSAACRLGLIDVGVVNGQCAFKAVLPAGLDKKLH
jgi:hypothetical protein